MQIWQLVCPGKVILLLDGPPVQFSQQISDLVTGKRRCAASTGHTLFVGQFRNHADLRVVRESLENLSCVRVPSDPDDGAVTTCAGKGSMIETGGKRERPDL